MRNVGTLPPVVHSLPKGAHAIKFVGRDADFTDSEDEVRRQKAAVPKKLSFSIGHDCSSSVITTSISAMPAALQAAALATVAAMEGKGSAKRGAAGSAPGKAGKRMVKRAKNNASCLSHGEID